MSAPKISVFIIAFNEEKNIERCLRSVSWADELVLVDGHSADRTAEIAKRYTNKIFLRKFTDYADQKNYALSQATGDWALSVDADEEVTLGLKKEILAAVTGAAAVAAYSIPRRSRIFGHWFRFSGTQDDRPVRFFRTKSARFVQPIHETLSVDGSTGGLKQPLNHYTYRDISDYMVRLNRYTSMEAELLRSAGRRSGNFELLVKPFLMFLKLFFLRQGFRDGIEGFFFCYLSSFYVFLKHAKLNEPAGQA